MNGYMAIKPEILKSLQNFEHCKKKKGPCGPELIWYQATKFEVSGHHHLPHEK